MYMIFLIYTYITKRPLLHYIICNIYYKKARSRSCISASSDTRARARTHIHKHTQHTVTHLPLGHQVQK
jgi:hypothetical protein